MARQKLHQVLKKTLDNLEKFAKNNDSLRRALSGIETHTLDFSPQVVFNATLEAIQDIKDVTPEQVNQIREESRKFSNGLKAAWKTEGFKYTQEASETARGPVNVFRSMTNSKIYKDAIRNYNGVVNQILNQEDRKYIDAEHSLGYGIAENALGYALGTDLHATLDIVKSYSETNEIKMFLEKIPQPFLNRNRSAFSVQLEIENKSGNRGTSSKLNSFGLPEQGFIKLLQSELREILEKEDWSNVSGSPTIREEIIASLVEAGRTGKAKKRGSVSKSTLNKKVKSRHTEARIKKPVEVQKDRNWSDLLPIINAKINSRVKANMGAPGLVNRTGTFAESVEITSVSETAQGYPSFTMSYDKTPYGVFDRRTGAMPWATPERDPYTLIEKSLRDILREEAIGRFYVKRS